MKIKHLALTAIVFLQAVHYSSFGQTNTFPASGNVGVGTITPAEKLSVLTATSRTGITHTDGTIKLGTFVGSGAGLFGTLSNHPLQLRTNNAAAQVTLLQNGNFGIGTTSPGGRLQVIGGDAYIQSVRVGIGGVTGDTTTGNTCLGKYALRNNSDYVWEDVLPWVGSQNTAIGASALTSNINGAFNTAVGSFALTDNTFGDLNTAVGYQSLSRNRAYNNTAVGALCLWLNTTGIENSALGYESLYTNSTGSNNVAVGRGSLYRNSTASFNTSVGNAALYFNTTGNLNTAIGYKALDSNTTATENTATGANALLGNKTGSYNTANGSSALYANTTGSSNTAVGKNALYFNKTGIQNTASGIYALYNNLTGNWNTAEGRYALYNNTTGHDNTGVGDIALYYNTTGGNNSALGYFASPNTGALSNTTALGYNTRTTASNQVRLGNSAIMSIGGYQDWTNISDGRVKRNIKENVPGLSFINQLKPVTYNLNLSAADKITSALQLDENIQHDNKEGLQEMAKARDTKEQISFTGFIAQEVEKAAKSISYDFSGVDAPQNDKDLYGLRYASFVVPLVKSVQELSKLNDEKDTKINELQKQIDELRTLITGNKKTAALQNEKISSASLEQNAPNPFNNATSISYTLPASFVSAKIIITDKAGKSLKEVNVSGSGKGNIKINTAAMNAGAYQYSLYVNNSLIDTKQMVLSR